MTKLYLGMNKVYQLLENVLERNTLNVATSLNNLALLYYSQGRYSDAEPLYIQALVHEKTPARG